MEKWEKRCAMVCCGVLTLALVLRQGGSQARSLARRAGAFLDRPATASFLLYLQTGQAIAPGQTEPQSPLSQPESPIQLPTEAIPQVTVPEETAPPQEIPLTPEDAALIRMKYAGDYRPDLEKLLLQPVALDFSGTEPRILIVHTHATEAYTPEAGWEYEENALARTLDTGYNMVRVGDELARMLQGAGIGVIHDRQLNDYPSYNNSYTRTLEVIQEYLAEYPTIQMVIDIHRDAYEDAQGNQLGTAVDIGGEKTAKLMLVVGTDEGVLSHPNWQENLAWALKLQVILERDYPGITRPMDLKVNRYNQHATPGSLILEVGTAGDSLKQALAAVRCFGGALTKAVRAENLFCTPGESPAQLGPGGA